MAEGRPTGKVHPDGKKETNAVVPSIVAFKEALADKIADEPENKNNCITSIIDARSLVKSKNSARIPLYKVDHKQEWEHRKLNQQGEVCIRRLLPWIPKDYGFQSTDLQVYQCIWINMM